MATVRNFGFVLRSYGTTHEGPFMVVIPCKNFVTIGLAVLKLLISV